MERQDIIKIKAGMSDPKGLLIPRGVREVIQIEIAPEVATFWFKDGRITKRFAMTEIALEQKKGEVNTVFLERFQKAVTKYPGKTKEEIRDLILSQLKQMGANVK